MKSRIIQIVSLIILFVIGTVFMVQCQGPDSYSGGPTNSDGYLPPSP